MKTRKESALINQYIDRIKKVGRKKKSKNTITNYKSDLEEFNMFIEKSGKNLLDVKRFDIEDFQISLVDKGRATSTIARKLVSIRMFYKYLAYNEAILQDPSEEIEVPREEERKPIYMTIDESKAVINATNSQPEPYKSRDRLILMIAFTTGIRAEEITNIKLEDIQGSTLTVIGKGNKQREVKLNIDVLKALNDYYKVRKNTTEFLFVSIRGTHMKKRTIQYTTDKYIKLAGLDTDMYSIHKIRHTAATMMHKNGTSIRAIQEILGHVNVKTTEMYTHVDDEQKQNAADEMVGMFG